MSPSDSYLLAVFLASGKILFPQKEDDLLAILQIAAVLCARGYLARVRWDPASRLYLVELIECDETTKVISATHVANDEQLLAWLIEQANRT